jgi:hypothetical protein
MESKYICKLCDMQFTNQGTYWVHVNRRKYTCISKEKCIEIVDQIQLQKDELNKTMLQKLKAEEDKHKAEEEKQKANDEIEKLKLIIANLHNNNDKKLEHIITKIENVQDTIENNQTAHQLTQINNTLNNNADNKMCFDIHFTENNKEKLSHISQEMMLKILNHKDFNDTLKHIAKTVFFHPEAPQNWKWCVTDKKAAEGALEYNAESNTVIRKSTGEVINCNMQNIIFQISDFLTNLKKNNCEFNDTQKRNREKIYETLGNDFTSEQINSIKGAGYDGRNLAKALWESLYITVESTPISRIKTKVKIV